MKIFYFEIFCSARVFFFSIDPPVDEKSKLSCLYVFYEIPGIQELLGRVEFKAGAPLCLVAEVTGSFPKEFHRGF